MIESTTTEQSTLRIGICGELDQHRACDIIEEIREKIHCTLPRCLILDLAEMSFTDSSGIALLLRLRRTMEEVQGQLQIINVQEQPRKLFRLAGLSQWISTAT